jgi:uncharacterized protein YecT (DUF1311 family)
MQRAWIAFRDAKCKMPRLENEGGSIAIPLAADCFLTETARQAIRYDEE